MEPHTTSIATAMPFVHEPVRVVETLRDKCSRVRSLLKSRPFRNSPLSNRDTISLPEAPVIVQSYGSSGTSAEGSDSDHNDVIMRTRRCRATSYNSFSHSLLNEKVAGYQIIREEHMSGVGGRKSSRYYVVDTVRLFFSVIYNFDEERLLKATNLSLAAVCNGRNVEKYADFIVKSSFHPTTKVKKMQYLSSALQWLRTAYVTNKMTSILNNELSLSTITAVKSLVSHFSAVLLQLKCSINSVSHNRLLREEESWTQKRKMLLKIEDYLKKRKETANTFLKKN